MNPALKDSLLKAAAGGSVAIALAMAAWYEGDGPIVKQSNGTVMYRPYIDPVGIPTVCRGVTGPDVVQGKLYSRVECDGLERKHMLLAEARAKAVLVFWSTYDKWTQAALIDFTYNLGQGSLASSTMARMFNAGDHDAGCEQLRLWIKGRVKGQLVTLNGLVDRRAIEQEVCLRGLQ